MEAAASMIVRKGRVTLYPSITSMSASSRTARWLPLWHTMRSVQSTRLCRTAPGYANTPLTGAYQGTHRDTHAEHGVRYSATEIVTLRTLRDGSVCGENVTRSTPGYANTPVKGA
jgi:hypothetical protein